MANRWGKDRNSDRLYFWAPKSLWVVTAAMNLKVFAPWKKNYDKQRQCMKKQRHLFASKGPSGQSYCFSRSHVRIWELDHKEGWMPKNWCFQAVVLEKTLESPLDCEEIKPINPKGNQPRIFTARTDAKAPILWPPDVKSQLIHCKRPWCWERLKAGEEGYIRGQDGWNTMDMSLSKLWETVKDREACHASVHRATVRHNQATE